MRNFCAFWVLAFLGSRNTSLAAIPEVPYEQNSILEPCLLTLCERYFTEKRKSGGGSLVVVNILQAARSMLQQRILAALNGDKNAQFSVMPKFWKRPHRKSNSVDKVQNYMIIIRETADVVGALDLWKRLPTWNPLAKAMLFFLNPINNTETKDAMVRECFSLLLKEGMLYANAMFQMSDDPYKMIVETYFPYQGKGCAKEVGRIHTIHECVVPRSLVKGKEKRITDVNENMFPKLPNTLHRCKLHVSAFIWAPFIIGSKEKGKVEAGVEFEMLKTITTQMEMKLVFKILNNTIVTKRVTDNQTDIYADLLRKDSDVAVGGLFENPISRKLVSSSIPYYQDDITWCVHKAGLAPTWLNVFIIFNISTWIGLLMTVVIASIFLYYFVRSEGRYRENYVWSFLMTMGLGTGQYAHYWPRKGAIRAFMAGIFFFGLHINTAYKSYLIKVLQNPRFNEQISTVTQAIEAGLDFYTAESALTFFEKTDSISKHLMRHHKLCSDLDECFRDIPDNPKKVLAISRAHAVNNPFRMDDGEDFFCFAITDDIVIYSAVMLFQRHHHLLPTINAKIRVLSEAGLLEQWQEESSRYARASDDMAIKRKSETKLLTLRLEHVNGAFLVILIGLGISSIVFLLELLTRWLLSRKKYPRFLKTMESFLCRA